MPSTFEFYDTYRSAKRFGGQKNVDDQSVSQEGQKSQGKKEDSKNIHNQRMLRRKLGPMVADHTF